MNPCQPVDEFREPDLKVGGGNRCEVGEGDFQLAGAQLPIAVVEGGLGDIQEAIAEAADAGEGFAGFVDEREAQTIQKCFDPRHGESLRRMPCWGKKDANDTGEIVTTRSAGASIRN